MGMKKQHAFALLGAMITMAALPLQGQLPAPRLTGDRYMVAEIGTLTGCQKLEALDINDKGEIAGRCTMSTGETRSMSFPPLIQFAQSADKRSEARGINNTGERTVYASYNSWITMRSASGGWALRYLPYIEVRKIASGPRIVGRDTRTGNAAVWNLTNATWVPQPGNSTLMPVGTPTSLGTLPGGGSFGVAMAISESGFITGYATDANGWWPA